MARATRITGEAHIRYFSTTDRARALERDWFEGRKVGDRRGNFSCEA